MRERYLISEKCQDIARAAHREMISRPHSSDIMERRVLLGGYSSEVPPLPIPNREVKLTNADGTAYLGGRVGSRLFKPSPNKGSVFFVCICQWSGAVNRLILLGLNRRRPPTVMLPTLLNPPSCEGGLCFCRVGKN